MTNESKNAVTLFRNDLVKMDTEFRKALPAHIPSDRFIRTVMTAVQNNPDIAAAADRQSVLSSCMKAAQDGLVLDGRDASLVIFSTKEKVDGKEVWIKKAQYMPMVSGIMKLVRNSGQLSTISVQLVYEKDVFSYNPAADVVPNHQPDWFGQRGKVIGVYAVARLKDGGVVVEIMSRDDVEAIRKRSKTSGSGPWVTDWNEMARKTVIRRISKYLPKSSDRPDEERLFNAIEREDETFDIDAEPEPEEAPKPAPKAKPAPKSAAEILSGDTLEIDPETGEVIDAVGPVSEPSEGDVM